MYVYIICTTKGIIRWGRLQLAQEVHVVADEEPADDARTKQYEEERTYRTKKKKEAEGKKARNRRQRRR